MDAVITQENGAYFRTLTKQVAGAERIDRQRIYPKKETILLTESDQNGKRISTRNKKKKKKKKKIFFSLLFRDRGRKSSARNILFYSIFFMERFLLLGALSSSVDRTRTQYKTKTNSHVVSIVGYANSAKQRPVRLNLTEWLTICAYLIGTFFSFYFVAFITTAGIHSLCWGHIIFVAALPSSLWGRCASLFFVCVCVFWNFTRFLFPPSLLFGAWNLQNKKHAHLFIFKFYSLSSL